MSVMPGATILIVDDEKGIADSASFALQQAGYQTLWVSTVMDARQSLTENQVDLIVLDIGLPDESGFEFIKSLRASSAIPVIFLTARHEEIDRILGFELGADDYLTKPFSPRELAMRVRAILKRSSHESGPLFVHNAEAHTIEFNGQRLQLTRYEYLLLKLLLQHPGWIFSREKIMDMVWDRPEDSFDRTVDTHIKNLRSHLKKIRPDLELIQTHRGQGYSLKEY